MDNELFNERMVRQRNVNLFSRYYIFIILLLSVLLIMALFIFDGNKKEQKAVPTSISLNKAHYELIMKEREIIFATAVYSDGSKKNISKLGTYTTTNEKVVTVDSSGAITGTGLGTAKVSVFFEGLTETFSVSVSEKRLSVNVKDYGAYGDGIHDDTSSFQQAIDHLAAKGGGDIFIPYGTYILKPIFLKPKINLVGQSRDQVILKLSDRANDEYTRLITMNNDTKVQSITCDGNYQKHPNGTEHMHCIFAFDKNNLVIENNRLMNAVGDGISISGSKETSNYVTVSNNIILENQRSQLVIEQTNHLFIYNNKITSKTGRPAIHFEPWEEIQLFDAVITGNNISTNSSEYCVLLAGSDSGTARKGHSGYFFHGVVFADNVVEGPECSMLVMDTSGAEIYNNELFVSDIFVWRRNKDLSIYSNLIKGESGIQIEGGDNGRLISTGTRIFDNTISSAADGINITAGAERTFISSNKFNGIGKGNGVYLFASDSIVDTTISNNIFLNFLDGVKTSSTKNEATAELTVDSNTFETNSGYALLLQGENFNIKMVSNQIKDTSGVFILIEPHMSINNVLIKDNVITGGKRGIYQSDNGKGSLKDLTISNNFIKHTTGETNDSSMEAVIELSSESMLVKDVVIKGNLLIGNKVNEIRVPKSLIGSVEENKFN